MVAMIVEPEVVEAVDGVGMDEDQVLVCALEACDRSLAAVR